MPIARHEVIHWFTTPEELSELAAEMEVFWSTCKPVQDRTVRSIYGKDAELKILVDQERITTPGWAGKQSK